MQEPNNYQSWGRDPSGGGTPQSYHRGGYLAQIAYGLRVDRPTLSASTRVVFKVGMRCTRLDGDDDIQAPNYCPSLIPNPDRYPDIPTELLCASQVSCGTPAPSFFTENRLLAATSQSRNGAAWKDLDRTEFDYNFPPVYPGEDPHLWLESVQRIGLNSDPDYTITESATIFRDSGGGPLDNRVDVDTEQGVKPIRMYRLQEIRDRRAGTCRSTTAQDRRKAAPRTAALHRTSRQRTRITSRASPNGAARRRSSPGSTSTGSRKFARTTPPQA